ncbi:Zinc finger protein 711-like Protein [Tribolium castaneum]|uniref:Zinc finger protein 711-like Protein n=1 Tax=Tribolium castaneum TaxID=7070 RepID=A0A139WCS4_TRICA|nr:Zinc finger protein 711-like Protein [Tribolium castaneum]
MMRNGEILKKFNCESAILHKYTCNLCKFKTSLLVLLNKHVRETHSNKSKKRSPQCPYVLKNYVCKSCAFQTYSSLHSLRHTKCGPCIKLSTESEKLFKRPPKPRQIRWLKCNQCLFQTKLNIILQRHIKTKHCTSVKQPNKLKKKPLQQRVEVVQWHKCKKCPFVTVDKTSLNEHMALKHQDEERWFGCEHCPFKTTMENSLKRHVKTKHAPCQNIEKCTTYRTTQKSDLAQHRKSEPDTQKECRHQCSHCDFKTGVENELQQHIASKHTTNNGNVQLLPYYYLLIQ